MSKIEMGKEIPFVFSLSLSLSIHSPIVRDFLFKWMNDLLFYSKAGFFCYTKIRESQFIKSAEVNTFVIFDFTFSTTYKAGFSYFSITTKPRFL